MSIMLTGATGYIGSHVAQALSKNGETVIAYIRKDSNISRLPSCIVSMVRAEQSNESLVEDLKLNKVSGIVHCAALMVPEPKSSDIEAMIQANVTGPILLLNAAVQAGIKWFIHTGTHWQHYNNATYDPVDFYAATKEAFFDLAAHFNRNGNSIVTTLTLNDTYGPDDERQKIINTWKKIALSREILAMSPGDQLIDLVHIEDLVEAYLRLSELLNSEQAESHRGKNYSIPSPRSYSLKELAAIFESSTGYSLSIDWGAKPYRAREIMVPWAGTEILPGWSPKVSVQDGFKQLFEKE